MARLDKMTKPELIGVIERDAVKVRRARQALADLAAMQGERDAAHAALEADRAKPPVTVERIVTKEVPTPCLKQAEAIGVLRAELAREKAKPAVERVIEVPVDRIVEKIVTQQVEVPGPERVVIQRLPEPCPEQAAEIDRLRADLNDFNRPEFRQWQKMRKVAGSE